MLAKIERSSLMGQLTASIAHELNQPLTGILGNAQAAKIYFNKNEYIEISDILDDIVHDSKRAGEVIRNLREIYQDQTGVFESIDLKSLVFNTIKLLNSELVGSQIRNEVIYEDEDLTITGNKVQIQQVLVNLIINAIESMSEQQRSHRKMVIAIKREKNMVQVYVEDSGTGLDEQLLPRIFEPFTSWKSGGTGMGLAISNNIVEAHGGHIWAVNTSDGGLRVGFDIPSGD
jgi:signal transduction histidine kinase